MMPTKATKRLLKKGKGIFSRLYWLYLRGKGDAKRGWVENKKRSSWKHIELPIATGKSA
jgi:hypothetical protein